MSKETFEEWCNYEKHHHNYSLFKEIWDYQQKKIDELDNRVSWLRENCKEWESWANGLEKVNKDLEAKLEVAVTALRHLRIRVDSCECKGWQPYLCISCVIRETLAEIEKGEL